MADLDLPQDYIDLLRELDAVAADYLVVGGWAVAIHGHGRATDDLDILVRPTPDNAAKVYDALARFGAPLPAHGVTPELFSEERYGYRMGRKPILIEILTTIDGVTFDEASIQTVRVPLEGMEIPFIGREALIRNKRAAGRPKDLEDIRMLEKIERRE